MSRQELATEHVFHVGPDSRMMWLRRISGEARRFYISLGGPGTTEYLVDLDEFNGNGWCSCKAFEFHHQAAMQDKTGISRCKHLIAIFTIL